MADLENLLLEAAGRTSSAGKNRHVIRPSRRTHPVDDGSDSRKEDSDDNYDYRSKRSASQVPVKKRNESAEREDFEGSEEGECDVGSEDDSDESDVGSDLYKNEDDRERLAEMTELEREMILSDRAFKKDDKSFKEKLRLKVDNARSMQSKKDELPPALSRGLRSSARTADRTAAMDGALNQLRAKRLKQQDSKAHGALKGSSNVQSVSAMKQKAPTKPSLSGSSESESLNKYDSEDEASIADGNRVDSDDESGMPGSEPPSYDDIKGITIQRSKLAKWFREPFFEDLIVGCFVRIGIGNSTSGPVYRLCMVQNVDSSKPEQQYKLDGKITHKYLICFWGNESSATKWQMAMVSDSAPSEQEFDQWFREVKRSGGRMLRKQDVLGKRETIQKVHSYVYSATTVRQMLQEKKHMSSRPLNIAVEKDRLKRQLEVAESKSDHVEVEKIKTRLQELEASRQARDKDAKAIRLAEMNKKNRAENFKNASELRPVNMSLKAGDAGYDPFSRRWTRSRNYYVGKAGQGDESNDAVEGTTDKDRKVTRETGIEATAAALEAAADAGKLVDTSAPMDQGTKSNMLHNFELPISLATLQKFGGPQGAQLGYLARKQRIEATIGCGISQNDGKAHAHTLTVSDYKRRRGLL
ncbi:RNA polymerase-associated protein Rtf [Trema orientale]|uniref:RNA polymerase-associated protein Rtf n=1 Tax=Trema orientale TaxID=63057 RepID=A0A2P5E7Y2_TREOI|nr:RNA polymerase-associated protein Rtf [Trema orientale]